MDEKELDARIDASIEKARDNYWNYKDGSKASLSTDDMIAVKLELASLRAQLAEANAERTRLSGIVERDRTKAAEIISKARGVVASRGWLAEGRGSYAYDDETYQEEFGCAIREMLEALEPLKVLAADWSDCPKDFQEARINWKERAEAAEIQLAEANARAEKAEKELSDISAAIGTVRYMDPPDGGDVSLAEQVRRMKAGCDECRRALSASLLTANKLSDELKSSYEKYTSSLATANDARDAANARANETEAKNAWYIATVNEQEKRIADEVANVNASLARVAELEEQNRALRELLKEAQDILASGNEITEYGFWSARIDATLAKKDTP